MADVILTGSNFLNGVSTDASGNSLPGATTAAPTFNNAQNFRDLNISSPIFNGNPNIIPNPNNQINTTFDAGTTLPEEDIEPWAVNTGIARGLKQGETHDVVNNYWWTLTPKTSPDGGGPHPARLETPTIKLREFKTVRSALTRAFDFYKGTAVQLGASSDNDELRATKVNINDLYGYYSPISGASRDLNRTYILPYFADSYFDIQSSYSDFARQMIEGAAGVIKSGFGIAGNLLGTAGGAIAGKGNLAIMGQGSAIGSSVGGSVGSMLMAIYAMNALGAGGVENLIKAVTQSPRAGFIDQPLTWNTSTQKTFNITFPLFNNYGDDAFNNWRLIWELTYANSFNKATAITSEPPYFYEVTIPNQYYTPAAYVSNITVKNLGNQRLIKNYIIPDAWLVSLTLVDFFVPSKNLMRQAFDGLGSRINAS
jgi:hypothetical protein